MPRSARPCRAAVGPTTLADHSTGTIAFLTLSPQFVLVIRDEIGCVDSAPLTRAKCLGCAFGASRVFSILERSNEPDHAHLRRDRRRLRLRHLCRALDGERVGRCGPKDRAGGPRRLTRLAEL